MSQTIEFLYGNVATSYTHIYESDEAKKYHSFLASYPNLMAPGENDGYLYEVNDFGGRIARLAVLAKTTRQRRVPRLAYFSHVMAVKDNMDFYRNKFGLLFDEGAHLADEDEFDAVQQNADALNWNRPLAYNEEGNLPDCPLTSPEERLLSPCQLKQILLAIFSRMGASNFRVFLSLDCDSREYGKRSLHILREIYSALPYMMRRRIGFCTSYEGNAKSGYGVTLYITPSQSAPIGAYNLNAGDIDFPNLPQLSPELYELVDFLADGRQNERDGFFDAMKDSYEQRFKAKDLYKLSADYYVRGYASYKSMSDSSVELMLKYVSDTLPNTIINSGKVQNDKRLREPDSVITRWGIIRCYIPGDYARFLSARYLTGEDKEPFNPIEVRKALVLLSYNIPKTGDDDTDWQNIRLEYSGVDELSGALGNALADYAQNNCRDLSAVNICARQSYDMLFDGKYKLSVAMAPLNEYKLKVIESVLSVCGSIDEIIEKAARPLKDIQMWNLMGHDRPVIYPLFLNRFNELAGAYADVASFRKFSADIDKFSKNFPEWAVISADKVDMLDTFAARSAKASGEKDVNTAGRELDILWQYVNGEGPQWAGGNIDVSALYSEYYAPFLEKLVAVRRDALLTDQVINEMTGKERLYSPYFTLQTSAIESCMESSVARTPSLTPAGLRGMIEKARQYKDNVNVELNSVLNLYAGQNASALSAIASPSGRLGALESFYKTCTVDLKDYITDNNLASLLQPMNDARGQVLSTLDGKYQNCTSKQQLNELKNYLHQLESELPLDTEVKAKMNEYSNTYADQINFIQEDGVVELAKLIATLRTNGAPALPDILRNKLSSGELRVTVANAGELRGVMELYNSLLGQYGDNNTHANFVIKSANGPSQPYYVPVFFLQQLASSDSSQLIPVTDGACVEALTAALRSGFFDGFSPAFVVDKLYRMGANPALAGELFDKYVINASVTDEIAIKQIAEMALKCNRGQELASRYTSALNSDRFSRTAAAKIAAALSGSGINVPAKAKVKANWGDKLISLAFGFVFLGIGIALIAIFCALPSAGLLKWLIAGVAALAALVVVPVVCVKSAPAWMNRICVGFTAAVLALIVLLCLTGFPVSTDSEEEPAQEYEEPAIEDTGDEEAVTDEQDTTQDVEASEAEANESEAELIEDLPGTISLTGGYELSAAQGNPLPDDVQTVFDNATENYVGMSFEPIAYMGSQVVAGTNYAILCKGTVVTAQPITKLVVVLIYADLDGNAQITNVCDFVISDYISADDEEGADSGVGSAETEAETPAPVIAGGWTVAVQESYTLDEKAQEAFSKAAYAANIETELVPVAYLGSQVVAGTNYALLCTETKDGETGIVLVIIYMDLEGNAEFTSMTGIDIADFNN